MKDNVEMSLKQALKTIQELKYELNKMQSALAKCNEINDQLLTSLLEVNKELRQYQGLQKVERYRAPF